MMQLVPSDLEFLKGVNWAWSTSIGRTATTLSWA